VALLAAIGFTASGTLFSAMAVRTRFAELLLPALLLPFLIPPLFFAAQATSRLLGGAPLADVWVWLRLLALYDIAFLALAALLFPAGFAGWAVGHYTSLGGKPSATVEHTVTIGSTSTPATTSG